jgi:neutral ceramidase
MRWYRIFSSLLFILFCIFTSQPETAAAQLAQLQAGVAKLNITPQIPVPMYGYGNRKDNLQGIHDSLYVRTLLFSDGHQTVAMIATDICEYQQDFSDYALPRIADETGIPEDHLMFTATHTHGGPVISLNEKQPEHVRTNSEWTLNQIIQCVQDAKANLQPARMGQGTGEAWVAMNRRARSADGEIVLGVNPTGPVDRSVGVIRVDALDGTPIAAGINFAVHGTVMSGKNYQITGDLPGIAEQYVEKTIGHGVIAPFYNGCSGDNNPIYHNVERFGTKIGEATILGQILGEEVVRVYNNVTMSDRAIIKAAADNFEIPGKPYGTFWPVGADTLSTAKSRKINLTAFRINGLVVCSISGEVFGEIGKKIKSQSPYRNTFVLSLTNGTWYYIPTADEFIKGGYEIKSSINTPEGEGIILDRMQRLLESL